MDCCAVFTDKLQAEFIYEHVEGAKVVAGMILGAEGIHDDVGFVRSTKEELHVEHAGPGVVASRLVHACNMVVLVHGSHVSARGRTFLA